MRIEITEYSRNIRVGYLFTTGYYLFDFSTFGYSNRRGWHLAFFHLSITRYVEYIY